MALYSVVFGRRRLLKRPTDYLEEVAVSNQATKNQIVQGGVWGRAALIRESPLRKQERRSIAVRLAEVNGWVGWVDIWIDWV